MTKCQCGQCSGEHDHLEKPSADPREMLKRFHDFPGEYMFKVIGTCHPGLPARAAAAVEKVVGPQEDNFRLRTRPSSGGKYLAVTLDVRVADADQVLAVYRELRKMEGLVVLV